MVDDIFAYSGFAVSEALKLGDHRLQLLCFDFFAGVVKLAAPDCFYEFWLYFEPSKKVKLRCILKLQPFKGFQTVQSIKRKWMLTFFHLCMRLLHF